MPDKSTLKKALKDGVKQALRDGHVNRATAINVGEGDSRTSVSTRQTVTRKDGESEVIEVREERRGS